MQLPPADPGPATSGNRADWFAEQVYPHDRPLKGYLRASFPSVRDVDDVVQESYLRIWKRQNYKPIESARAFLFQIARRLAIDDLRRRKAVPFESLGDLAGSSVIDGGPSAAQLLSHCEKVSLLVAALARLPARCREVFILRKFDGVPQKGIAQRLGIAEATVENQVTRAMKLLEADLRRRGLDGFRLDEP